MSKLPKILVSSVIRSTQRGDSHGGLYVVDLEKGTHEQVLDWKYPHISWDSGGGDRGLRGLKFYNGELYAAGSRAIFVFDENYELVRQYRHNLLVGTHEIFIYQDHLFVIANAYDLILVFDLKNQIWPQAFQHILNGRISFLNPETPQVPEIDANGDVIRDENDPLQAKWHMIEESDTMHLDSVSVYGGWVFYAGSTTEYIYALNLANKQAIQQPLYFKNTHNAQPWKDGIIFNRSLESDTCYQVGMDLVQHWQTPSFPNNIENFSYNDHAKVGYTRGMVLTKDHVIVGTSPASVHVFEVGNSQPVQSVNLTNDVRNSVCGMCALEEPSEEIVNWRLSNEN